MHITQLSGSLLALVLLTGCRSSSVTNSTAGRVDALANQRFTKVYFVPFDLSNVELSGDHPADGKEKWSSRVVMGAQKEFEKSMPGVTAVYVKASPSQHDIWCQEKYGVKLEYVAVAPPGSVVVDGSYVASHNPGVASRIMAGMWAGKSWTRARVNIKSGDITVYNAAVTGKYLGGGYSYGYEALGANYELGKCIAELISGLQKGTISQ